MLGSYRLTDAVIPTTKEQMDSVVGKEHLV